MRSRIGIQIAAPPVLIFELACDIERWPVILPHYRRVRPLRRTDGRLLAEYVALRPLVAAHDLSVPVVWRSWSWSDPRSLEISFLHEGGVTDGMAVLWHIEPDGVGSHVTIEHRFERRLPLPGALRRLGGAHLDRLLPTIVDRLVVRPIATLTLRAMQTAAADVARESDQ